MAQQIFLVILSRPRKDDGESLRCWQGKDYGYCLSNIGPLV